ncbi:electron transfer flavoprotein subunit alpha [Desulforhabdus amnigena]|jgi:electron transfer flavoprotein alpha subunit|uniref:Electron transfer flavoprotein subunit alpha n=1 Tax=Desulforhabdus amnigena TaxID=40218 RepID=A0A9W6CWH9_9BACT|nr:electron transfer flavoprotein subunit alpha [Desulforhabdus amnigena]NLJ28831.1 electron transfer flavoprotein subunit alpha [Deltaproteobacteria bacterium]GLI33151.1 electron transfer flavoprotein subunit alpha [Desulforhabdus amnigena]
MKAIVDRQKCTVCGVCTDVCPFGAISLKETCIEISDECTLCGMCVDTCEFGALSLPEVGTGPAADLASYKGVWVFAEWREGVIHKVGHELLSAGRKLADKRSVELAAVLLGYQLDKTTIEELISYGADVVYVVDHPELAHFRDEAYAKAIVELIRQKKPEILLAGATSMGRSFIPRVAASVKTGLTADCTELDISDEGLLLQTRPAFGGNVMATIVCPNRRPQMATVRPKVMKPEKKPGHHGRVENLTLSEECFKSRVEVLEVIPEQDQTAKLTEADIIVSGGRGLRKSENFAIVEELAQLIKGAVGASRGAVEEGWIAPSHQVGQTGRTVAPTLYMAVGIAGAIQHVVGMQGSKVIVAVNKDPQAPIFDVATYGVVADLFEFVPAFVQKIKQERGE